jgi:hypothetical protein
MYDIIENKKIPTRRGIRKNMKGRVKINTKNTFHAAISFTSFLANSEYKKVNAKNVKNGM